MPPVISEKHCVGCGMCVEVCPQDVFFGSEKGSAPVITYPEECWHCNACVLDCPKEGAIQVRVPLPMLLCHQ